MNEKQHGDMENDYERNNNDSPSEINVVRNIGKLFLSWTEYNFSSLGNSSYIGLADVPLSAVDSSNSCDQQSSHCQIRDFGKFRELYR